MSREQHSGPSRDYGPEFARALATPGGHVSIGRGGATLHYDHSTMTIWDVDACKGAAIAAGLAVIDSRTVPIEAIYELLEGPMVAVGQPPSDPPYHGLSYAPLPVVAERYRLAGAEVFNIPPPVQGLTPTGPETVIVATDIAEADCMLRDLARSWFGMPVPDQ